MKIFFAGGLILLLGASGNAFADCSQNSKVTGATLTNLITGRTICATQGTEKWQEQHRSGGQLWDYKKGPSDSVDPTAQVGNWSIAANTLTHSYGSSSYSYSVHAVNGNSYTLCPANLAVTIQDSPSCGF